MNMFFRATETSPTVELTYTQLRALVRKGEVPPSALVCDLLLTQNEWWTIDNLRLFHQSSPHDHPPGERLRKSDAARAKRRAEEEEDSQHLMQLLDDYCEGNLLERSLGLAPLENLLADPGVIGASRLWILPSFFGEEAWTLEFRENDLGVEIVSAQQSIWYQEFADSTPDLRVDPSTTKRRLAYARAPSPMKAWWRFLELAMDAPDTAARLRDGTSFRHQVLGPTQAIDVCWFNPRMVPNQAALILAYWECLQEAGLLSRIPTSSLFPSSEPPSPRRGFGDEEK